MKKFNFFFLFLFLLINAFCQSSSNGESFCFEEMQSDGTTMTSRITLYNGGNAEISFLSESGKLLRKGDASWSGQNDGPGGNMPVITVTLSTGARLRFKAVVDQYSNKITELIDSRDRIYSNCQYISSEETDNLKKNERTTPLIPKNDGTSEKFCTLYSYYNIILMKGGKGFYESLANHSVYFGGIGKGLFDFTWSLKKSNNKTEKLEINISFKYNKGKKTYTVIRDSKSRIIELIDDDEKKFPLKKCSK